MVIPTSYKTLTNLQSLKQTFKYSIPGIERNIEVKPMAYEESAIPLLRVTLAVIIGTLAAIVYSLRVLVLMERRVARMEQHVERMASKIISEEMKIKSAVSTKRR